MGVSDLEGYSLGPVYILNLFYSIKNWSLNGGSRSMEVSIALGEVAGLKTDQMGLPNDSSSAYL